MTLPTKTSPPIQLLALDLDGTLVRDDLTIDHRIQALLHAIQAKGQTKVVIATGRMHPSAKLHADALGITEPVISYQGGMICAQDPAETRLYHQPIDFSVTQKLWAFLDEHRFHTNTYIENILYTHATNPFLDLYRSLSGLEPTLVNHWQEVPQQSPTKLMVIDDTRIDDLLAFLRNQYGDSLTYFRSRTNFCEIIAPNVTKWSAVWWLAQQWGIPQRAIMACGDQDNDLAMIEAAGVGVAMGNAPPHIQAKATLTAQPVHGDGLVAVLEELLETGAVSVPEGACLRG